MDLAQRTEPIHLRTGRAFVGTTTYLQSFALLIARLGFGLELFITGWGHLHHADMMIQRFSEWHVPMPSTSVYISGYTEMLGGLLLFFGLLTRIVSIAFVINFIVAYLTASVDKVKDVLYVPKNFDGFRMTFAAIAHPRTGQLPPGLDNWDTFLSDAAFPFLIIALIFLAFGPGKVSIDWIIKRIFYGRGDVTFRRATVIETPEGAEYVTPAPLDVPPPRGGF